MIRQPVSIYNNWSSYDELSDNVVLTEELAMKQLDEMLRLRDHGVRFDYYLMDAFWFAPDGGYRTWRKPHWPDGPDEWLAKCIENGIKPGLWLSGNTLCHLDMIPQWKDSFDPQISAMCMFTGGFLNDFVDVLQYWYDRGVRAFKLDFFRFDAATPEIRKTVLLKDVIETNESVLRSALMAFRETNPEALFAGYNGLGGEQGNTSIPFYKNVDVRWLEAFDSLYCGDPRPADVPCMNYWRSMDIYSDHMVRSYEFNGIPLERIDNTAFMIGTTGTCCKRGKAAWKGMLLLSLARGGWVNIYYGNLDLLDEDDADWFARVQYLYMNMQALGRTYTFGGVPGESAPYGFASVDSRGALYTVVNPSQTIAKVDFPVVSDWQTEPEAGLILFRDAGFEPSLSDNAITLGPGQLALVGFGQYASKDYNLGVEEDVVIPSGIEPVAAKFIDAGKNVVSAEIDAPASGILRIVMQQFRNGRAFRVSGGSPPEGATLENILKISVRQNGRDIAVKMDYDKAIWSGLSWGAGEIDTSHLTAGQQLTVRCESTVPEDVMIEARVYVVEP